MTALLILLILLAILGSPNWPWSGDWGYFPSGLLVSIIVILVLFGLS